ncbi:hydantoinase/oxoprolinase family protein [Halobacterium yunchengense]|uniref:hydantoinase/oxoprolinase family protein n=1 Tax=Halobacterium yunchengense TaxID=3108497 RepID=UPI0030082A8B
MSGADRPRAGVDVGGTFTDVVAVDDGRVDVTKVPSTPDHPERAVLDGLEDAAADGDFALADLGFLGHGTTVATNAVLEGEWADTALVTTEGFRDALEIGRQDRPDIYDFRAEQPDPIVPRDRRFEVRERLDERGSVVEPLDEAGVEAVADELADADVDSVAVSLLFAFEDDAHERRVREVLRASGVDASLSLSSVVLPEIREYERTLTTVLNAALKPVMDDYVGSLAADVRDRGVASDLKLMQSNGGLVEADAARERPVHTLLSGPAAGVQGATHVAAESGFEDLVTMDMGGTSCDVSLVEGGDPVVATDVEVGDYAVGVPMVDVHTVGAGGGSVAWLDEGGALRVGPQSAGAVPGPVAYGRGGDRPTTTDAHVLLGRLDPSSFLTDGAADEAAVRDRFESELAGPLDCSVREAAQGVLDVANANMERALRVVSVERGHDPRDFALVAFGGAGPLHAATLAAELDVPQVVVPRTAGVLSALGLLVSDVKYDFSVSRVRRWSDVDPDALGDALADLRQRGEDRLDDEGVAPGRRAFERRVDLRYVGQSFSVPVAVPDGDVDADSMAAVERRFHDAHERRYGHADPGEDVELVTVRLDARGAVDPPELGAPTAEGDAADAVRETRAVVFDGDAHDARVYDRNELPAGATFDGPAVVEGDASTVVVRPGQTARVDDAGSVVVDAGGGR